jgi:hypothetical protein
VHLRISRRTEPFGTPDNLTDADYSSRLPRALFEDVNALTDVRMGRRLRAARAGVAGKYKGRPVSIDAAQIKQLGATLGPVAIAKKLGIARSIPEDGASPRTTLPIRIDYTYDTHALRHAPCLNWCRGPRQPGTDYRNCGRAGAIPLAGQFAQVAELNDRSACGWSTVLSGVRERTTSSTRSGWCRLATNSVPASAKHHASWTLIGAPEIGCQ